MLLSRLEIIGFKSFPEKTILDFNGGITGVVGPNGCGKSNILDSIRWVLGEQRSSVLRSSKMEEVIFSGTKTLKPTGMAEVNLTIKNNRGVLPVEYNDIVITRRLFRSGESEYYLNRNKCRLKDIMELFFDTGMGPHAYSVIQQGMIDSILSDKTEDRRSLFEEAAGVTKYKHRKKEAENKLQATEADLLRLGDVMAEIEKQVDQLRRQARRAGRYSARKNDLKKIELTLAAALMFKSEEKYKKLLEEKKDLEIEIESSSAMIDKFEINIQDLKMGLSEREAEASRFRQEESVISLAAAEKESGIRLSKQKADSNREEIEKRKINNEELLSRIESLKGEIKQKEDRLREIGVQKTRIYEESGSLENGLSDAIERLSLAEKDFEQKTAAHVQVSERISGIKAERLSLENMKDSLASKMMETEQNARDYHLSKSENGQDIKKHESRREDLLSQIDVLKTEQKSAEDNISARDNSLLLLRDKISVSKAECSGLRAQQELLEQLIDTGEGYSGGAKAIMAWENKPSGILIPIAEALNVPERYRVAVNAALGDMGEIIPARTYEDARAAIDYLKANETGRSTFIMLDKLGVSPVSEDRPKGIEGFIGYLNDLVTYPDEYEPAIRLLLGRVALFESEKTMLEADARWQYYSRVSADGLVILPSAMISGGKAASGIFGRRHDLHDITEKLDILSAEIRNLEDQFQKEETVLNRLRDEYEDNGKIIARLETDRGKIDADLAQLKFDFKQKENEYSAAMNEASRLSGDIEQYEKRIIALSEELAGSQSRFNDNASGLERSSRNIEELKSKVKEIENGLTKAQIRKVKLDGYEANINSEINHARELCNEAEKMIQANNDGIAKAERIIESAFETIENLKNELEDCFDKRNKTKDYLLKTEGIISEQMGEIGDIEKRLIEKRKSKEKSYSLLHDIDMESKGIESSRNSIIERINYEFGISAIEPAELEENQSIESLKERAEKIRLELQRMEPVNLMAAEDYERENDRYNFLLRQREDLLEAKTSLKEAINRINIAAEQRFNQTFSAIEKNYQKVFSRLFENGEAHVELEEPLSPLESPIKIMARPGGKKLLSVAQLSGGERALTAISLLFAIYLVKPSPFCILDEVDAPLDDVNLVRFLKLIKGFAEDTQFIIITHNKLTMEASDILYGVTMENPGVSKVVSVKFGGGNGDGDQG